MGASMVEIMCSIFYQHKILPEICVLEARGKEQAMPVEEVQTDQAM